MDLWRLGTWTVSTSCFPGILLSVFKLSAFICCATDLGKDRVCSALGHHVWICFLFALFWRVLFVCFSWGGGNWDLVGEYWQSGLLTYKFSVHVISIRFLITTLVLFRWLWSNWEGMRKSFRFSYLCWKKKKDTWIRPVTGKGALTRPIKRKGRKRQNSVSKSLFFCLRILNYPMQ